ncbi:MAG TPA: NmrA family NAD(P)-binding protein [Pyrinomonadaceae bacterium]|nr:NmrA family NAD(P)-binding protein [Pyrinomonadaceae bacterium]
MYAIMGATGNTGNVVARTLLAKGHKVRAIGRNPDRLASLRAEGAEVFVGDAMDTTSLAKAFVDAQAVYAMIPPNMTSSDYRAEQNQTAEAIAGAVERERVKYVVTLSSVGADKAAGTGPIAGLHYLEGCLNRIPDLTLLNLRAAYFMDNTLGHIGTIQAMGVVADSLRSDLKIPMIATRDIGAAVAKALLEPVSNSETHELLGERDLTMEQVTSIIGTAINKPDLKYVQLTDEQVYGALTQAGLTSSIASLIIEMGSALNSGHVRPLEGRSSANTTPTSFESFVTEEFVPRFQAKSATA